jgi:hypothetical protein
MGKASEYGPERGAAAEAFGRQVNPNPQPPTQSSSLIRTLRRQSPAFSSKGRTFTVGARDSSRTQRGNSLTICGSHRPDRPMTTDLQTLKSASKSLGFGPRREEVSRSLTARVLPLPIGGSPGITSPLSPARTAAAVHAFFTPSGPRKQRKVHVPPIQRRAGGDASILAPTMR